MDAKEDADILKSLGEDAMHSCHGVRKYMAIYRTRQQRMMTFEALPDESKGKIAGTSAYFQCATKRTIGQEDTRRKYKEAQIYVTSGEEKP